MGSPSWPRTPASPVSIHISDRVSFIYIANTNCKMLDSRYLTAMHRLRPCRGRLKNQIASVNCTTWTKIQNVAASWISCSDSWKNDVRRFLPARPFQNNHWIYIGYMCWLKNVEDSSRYARCRSCSIVSLRLSDLSHSHHFCVIVTD